MIVSILALIMLAAAPAAPATSSSAKPPAAKSAKATTAKQTPTSESQGFYDQARFDDAITLLRDLVDRGALSSDAQLRAREILARCYVKKGYPVLAKSHFKAILAENPSFRPDPLRVPPDEAAVFDQALREYREELGPKGGSSNASTKPQTPPRGVVVPASTTPYHATPGGASLEVQVRPFASYYVDDTLRASNVVSTRLNLSPGMHTVRVVHPSFEAKEWTVKIEAGKVTKLEHDFPAMSAGTVRVSSGGIWAEVFLDGKTTGKTTPCILEGLSYGNHVITVARTGFALESGPQVVTVRPGESPISSFRLRTTP